jgi:hypothetical protein
MEDEDMLPFHSEEDDDVMLEYKCKNCGFEDLVPDFVAKESYIEEEFDKETGCPTVLCIECDGVMIERKYFKD